MSTAYKLLPHYTYEDYRHWEGQWEVIDGIPFAMSPATNPRHQLIATNLASEFRIAIKQKRCACKAYQPIDWVVLEDTIFQPDLVVTCKPIDKKYLDFAPDLVAEILSESTGLKDRTTKFAHYQKAGVKYYLIVDGEREEIEIYELKQGEYSRMIFDPKQSFEFGLSACNLSVVLHEVWS